MEEGDMAVTALAAGAAEAATAGASALAWRMRRRVGFTPTSLLEFQIHHGVGAHFGNRELDGVAQRHQILRLGAGKSERR